MTSKRMAETEWQRLEQTSKSEAKTGADLRRNGETWRLTEKQRLDEPRHGDDLFRVATAESRRELDALRWSKSKRH